MSSRMLQVQRVARASRVMPMRTRESGYCNDGCGPQRLSTTLRGPDHFSATAEGRRVPRAELRSRASAWAISKKKIRCLCKERRLLAYNLETVPGSAVDPGEPHERPVHRLDADRFCPVWGTCVTPRTMRPGRNSSPDTGR